MNQNVVTPYKHKSMPHLGIRCMKVQNLHLLSTPRLSFITRLGNQLDMPL